MVNLHYLSRYNRFINFYKNKIFEGYNEKHHIIPKCIGGEDAHENLILLPARAHFICHYILHKAYPDNKKLALAFSMMIVNNPHQKRFSKFYEKAKLARALALKNVPRPEWVKEKLRKPKSNTENYKKPKSENHKKNIGIALKGRKCDWQHKTIESDGYKQYQKQRSEKRKSRELFHRENFSKMNITRKEYYSLFPDLSIVTLKRYLRGL